MMIFVVAPTKSITISMRGINCQFCRQFASIVPRNIMQLLFSEKSQNCQKLNNHYS
jgi:hypothetical protein